MRSGVKFALGSFQTAFGDDEEDENRDDIRNHERELGRESHPLQPHARAVRRAENEGRAENAERIVFAENRGGDGDPAAPGGHVRRVHREIA